MKITRLITLACGLLAAGALSAREPAPSPEAVWKAANFINVEWLNAKPEFVAKGHDDVGYSTFNARNPKTGEPYYVDITWTISELDAQSEIRKEFAVPKAATCLVTARFKDRTSGRSVDTFSAVSVRGGKLIAQHLGLKEADGTTYTDMTEFARSVFSVLQIPQPISSQAFKQP